MLADQEWHLPSDITDLAIIQVQKPSYQGIHQLPDSQTVEATPWVSKPTINIRSKRPMPSLLVQWWFNPALPSCVSSYVTACQVGRKR
eukprot:3311476-Amphidinium_carterae.1